MSSKFRNLEEDTDDEEGLSTQILVKKEKDGFILLRVDASVFFDSGKAEINSEAEPLLYRVSDIFVEYEKSIKIIRIEGHTDNVPMHSDRYDSNWELSVSRSVNVLRRILELSNLEPKKLSAVGYNEFYPIASNDSSEGRALNRRVDFFIEPLDENNEKLNK